MRRLKAEGILDADTQGGGHELKGQAWPVCQAAPTTPRSWKRQWRTSLESQKEVSPADTLILDFWPPELYGTNFYCFKQPSVWQTQETHTNWLHIQVPH
jgi:hypothetical protein